MVTYRGPARIKRAGLLILVGDAVLVGEKLKVA